MDGSFQLSEPGRRGKTNKEAAVGHEKTENA